MPAKHAQSLCTFIDESPTPYHAVATSAAFLDSAGFARLDERSAWRLEPGKAYYLCREGAALVAFRLGRKAPSEAGFALAGAHVDSPALRARAEKSVAARGLERVAVEPYGGPIHSTWLDRPLSLAGRVVVEVSGRREARLVHTKRPVGIIPNLAIHFNREMNKGVEYTANATLLPLVGAQGGAAARTEGAAVPWLVSAICAELGVSSDAFISADLSFVDAAPALTLGCDAELLSAPRIDNLEGCHAILMALASAQAGEHCQVAALFDNEEVGSTSTRGADSAFLRDVLERVVGLCEGPGSEAAHRALARSFCVSVDGAQGWHPAYADRFDEDFAPVLNGGPAVKANANVRYATDALGEAAFRALCRDAGVPCQRFRMRADLAPGSTIGPVSSALLGVRTVDVGVPMLAMHSVRETAGAYDHDSMIAALSAFYASGPDCA